MLIRKLMLAALLALSLTAHAESPEDTLRDQAIGYQAGDAASTIGALALGAVEANPLGPGVILLKPLLLWGIGTLPAEERPEAYAFAAFLGSSATANNICVIVAIATGGSFGPMCLAVGAAYGIYRYQEMQVDVELAHICQQERLYWGNPDMTCDFKRG